MTDDKFLAAVAALARTFVPGLELRRCDDKVSYLRSFFSNESPARALIDNLIVSDNKDRFIEFMLMDERELEEYLD